MTNAVYKYFLKLILAALLTGCASASAPNLKTKKGLSPLPAIARKPPIHQLSVQYRTITTLPAYSYGYSAYTLSGIYANSVSVQNFIQHMVQKYGFSETYLNGLFSQANRLYSVINLENAQQYHPPGPRMAHPRSGSWSRYRNQFITDAHINDGVRFWYSNADAIQKASLTYGVDPEYIVAIIGVETYFGRNIGKTCTFDALTTLAFDTQRRSGFFTSELENFLLMTREESYEPRKPVGSWAGAMGLGQFMPSSFRRLAVDFNNDGHRDLWHQHDAIGSVAHYFSRSGWQLNRPVAIQTSRAYDPSIIELSTFRGNEYWQVYSNFKVIKRYNNSNKYAMAVHQLAQAIKQRY